MYTQLVQHALPWHTAKKSTCWLFRFYAATDLEYLWKAKRTCLCLRVTPEQSVHSDYNWESQMWNYVIIMANLLGNDLHLVYEVVLRLECG